VEQGSRVPAERHPEPLLRYQAAPSLHLSEGTHWAFGKAGRPLALAALEHYPRRDGEALALLKLVSLSDGPVAAEDPDQGWKWTPQQAGVLLRPFPEAPAPADDAAGRLRQMQELAARFTLSERPGPREKPEEMHLLAGPVYRYADPGAGLLDGSLFCFARASNPEVVLLLEARLSGSSRSAWQYALARMRRVELSAGLDGQQVWKQPPIRPRPEDAYWYIQGPPYRPQKP
jgi:hypothetical protein